LTLHCTEFESHRHLRVSINVSIWVELQPLTCSFVIRFSATSHRQPAHLVETAMVERFQFDRLLSVPSSSPQSAIFTTIA
jgi:EAL domain-containing protein (putative c-di-GMP-specific phosphodiesterase class I)